MATRVILSDNATIAAKVRRTEQVIPSRATIQATTLASLTDVTVVTTTDTSVLTYNSGTSTFQMKEHPYLDHTPGVLTANSAVLVDANSNVDYFSVENFRIQSSGESTDYIDTIVQEITESANNNQIATSLAVKTYVDDNSIDSANVAITGGTITGVQIDAGGF